MRLSIRIVLLVVVLLIGCAGALRAQNTTTTDSEAAAKDSLKAQADSMKTVVEEKLPKIDPEAYDPIILEEDEFPPYDNRQNATPYHTITWHLYFLQKEHYDPLKASESMYLSKGTPEKERKQLARELYDVLNGYGVYVDLDALPRNPAFADSSGKPVFALSPDLPSVYLERINGRWYYSRATVRKIPSLYDDMFPFGLEKLVASLPHKGSFLGLKTYQYILIALLIAVTIALYWLTYKVAGAFIINVIASRGWKDVAQRYIAPVTKPFSFFLMLLFIRTVLPAIGLPVQINELLFFILKLGIPFMGILIAFRLVNFAGHFGEKYAEKTESNLDDQLLPIVKTMVKVIIGITGFVVILDNFGVNVTALLAGLSIGGLAFAFAAQDTISNFFGSLMIFVDKPFQIGDWVKFGSHMGTIENVGMRSTKVRADHDAVISIPNGELANMVIENFGLRRYRAYWTNFGLQYDTPPDLLEAYVDGLREIAQGHPMIHSTKHEIHVNSLGDSSINIMVFVFFDVSGWSMELVAKQEFILSALRLAEQLGVAFAFPTQTLHIETMPEKQGNSLKYDDNYDQAVGNIQNLRKVIEETFTPVWESRGKPNSLTDKLDQSKGKPLNPHMNVRTGDDGGQ